MHPFRVPAAALAVFSALVVPASAQVDLGWFHLTDTASLHSDGIVRIAIGADGSIAAAVNGGSTPSAPPPLLVYAANGALLWSTTWTIGGDRVVIADLAIDPASGDVFVVGTSRAYSNEQTAVPGSSNIAVGRFRAGGAKVWEQSWNGPAGFEDYGSRIALDGRGHVVVAGVTAATVQPFTTSVVVSSYDLAGSALWTNVVAATNTYSASVDGLATAGSGDVLVASTGAGPYPNVDIALTRLDASGAEAWTRTFAGTAGDFDRAYALAVDAASNAYVAGLVSTPSGASSVYEAALISWDPSGALRWSRVGAAIHPNSARLVDIAVDAHGDVVACGNVYNGVQTSSDALVVKYDPIGQPVWQRTWTGEGDRIDGFSRLALDAQRGIAVAGTTAHYYSAQVLETDPIVVRYDADGATRWEHRGLFTFPNSDGARDVAFGANGAVVYGGVSTSTVAGLQDSLLVSLREQGVPFCFGDGSDNVCPCFNQSAPGDGAGCLNSLGVGARIFDTGDASRMTDTLVLHTTGTPDAPVLFYQGTTQVNLGHGQVFGDGLSCAGGVIIRLGTVTATSGAAAYPPPGGIPVSVRGMVLATQTRHYQARYRNAAVFCTSNTYNQTNGLSILWGL